MRWLVLPALLALALASCRSGSQTSGESQPATAGSQPAPPAKPSAPAAADTPSLAVGSEAPDFALPGSDGHVHRLADDRGKRAVVVAWFPKAFTSG